MFGFSLFKAVASLVAFCTDFGVESMIAKTWALLLAFLYPAAVVVPFEDEAHHEDATGDDMADDDFINYSVALQVPGCVHILHNAPRDFADGLPNMVSVKIGMNTVS